MTPVGVIGAGAFGTAIACALAGAGTEVKLWGRNHRRMAEMASERRNRRYLPGCRFPKRVTPTGCLVDLSDIGLLFMVIPSAALAGFLVRTGIPGGDAPVVLCAKGIDRDHCRLQTEILASEVPDRRAAVLTGPGFAVDLAAGQPVALTLACRDPALGREIQTRIATPVLRPYLTTDTVGAQLGGALKNVVAIACGIAMGAGLGESARAALLTRGAVEITRLAVALGGRPETLAGLSGFGDLVLTSTSERSRNYAFGLALGAGRPPLVDQTVEGVGTAEATVRLARRKAIDMPVADAVAGVLESRFTVREALESLMSRPLRAE